MAPQLDQHYWGEVAHAEVLRDELLALHGSNTPQDLNLRQTLSAELNSLEAHLQRELSEAAFLAVGHRST